MRISDWSSDVCSSDLGLQKVTTTINPSATSANTMGLVQPPGRGKPPRRSSSTTAQAANTPSTAPAHSQVRPGRSATTASEHSGVTSPDRKSVEEGKMETVRDKPHGSSQRTKNN